MDGTLAKWNNVSFEELFKEGYYRNLEPNLNVVKTINRMLENGENIYILSAYLLESKYAKKEKEEWLQEYIPNLRKENYILIPYGENKVNFMEKSITEDDILLDDYTKNLEDWTMHGGTAVKLLNGINHTKGTWHGKKVDINKIDELFLNKAVHGEIKIDGKLYPYYFDINNPNKRDCHSSQWIIIDIVGHPLIKSIYMAQYNSENQPSFAIIFHNDIQLKSIMMEQFFKDKVELLEAKKEIYLFSQFNIVGASTKLKPLNVDNEIKEELFKKYPYLSQTRDFRIIYYFLKKDELDYLEHQIRNYDSNIGFDHEQDATLAICWYEGLISTQDMIKSFNDGNIENDQIMNDEYLNEKETYSEEYDEYEL